MKAGKMNAAAAAKAPATSPQPIADVSSQLHHRGPGQHLAQSQAIHKFFLAQPALFIHGHLPHGLQHGQAAEGG